MSADDPTCPVVLELDHDLDAVTELAELLGELAADLWIAGSWDPEP